jgi:hypothetical protein
MEISDKLVMQKLLFSVEKGEAIIQYEEVCIPTFNDEYPSIQLKITYHPDGVVGRLFEPMLEQIRQDREEWSRQYNEQRRLAEAQKPKPTTFLYVMVDKRTGYHKIGRSKDPKYRERTLQADAPEIEMVFCFEGYVNQEKRLHEKYAEKRVRGEWFDLSENDLIDIQNQLSDD